MKFNAGEECTKIKATKLESGNYHLEFFLKQDSVLKQRLLENHGEAKEELSDDMIEKLKEIWTGPIITFHT